MGNRFEEGNPKEYPGATPIRLKRSPSARSTRQTGVRPSHAPAAHIGSVAPGVNILSTVPRVKASFADHDELRFMAGNVDGDAPRRRRGGAALRQGPQVQGRGARGRQAADDQGEEASRAVKKKAFTQGIWRGPPRSRRGAGEQKGFRKIEGEGQKKEEEGEEEVADVALISRSERGFPWMSVQFKFSEKISDDRRLEIIEALRRAGFAAHSLFPGQKRPKLASIFTVTDAGAKNVKTLETTLARFGADIEYVEAAPARSPKS